MKCQKMVILRKTQRNSYFGASRNKHINLAAMAAMRVSGGILAPRSIVAQGRERPVLPSRFKIVQKR